MRRVTQSTQEAIKNERIRRKLTLDGLIRKYGLRISKGTLSRAVRGKGISLDAEREIRRGLGLPDRASKPAHRPYITDARKWRAYQEWSRQYDAQEDTQP